MDSEESAVAAITNDNYQTFVDTFDDMLNQYKSVSYENEDGEAVDFTETNTIEIPQSSFDTISDVISSFVDTSA
ncbi:MAG: hypothetical protein MJ223_00815 [Mycoplasmoidaceae bacterium]|nr:hypothetical protein [Mycoplasmoidaceae bacterium]